MKNPYEYQREVSSATTSSYALSGSASPAFAESAIQEFKFDMSALIFGM
mgnify:CR=1 FL=1